MDRKLGEEMDRKLGEEMDRKLGTRLRLPSLLANSSGDEAYNTDNPPPLPKSQYTPPSLPGSDYSDHSPHEYTPTSDRSTETQTSAVVGTLSASDRMRQMVNRSRGRSPLTYTISSSSLTASSNDVRAHDHEQQSKKIGRTKSAVLVREKHSTVQPLPLPPQRTQRRDGSGARASKKGSSSYTQRSHTSSKSSRSHRRKKTKSRPIHLDVCVDSVRSATTAEQAGATSVELCSNFIEGGTTPSAGMIQETRKHVSIPVHVMIRPRGGDFVYSQDEYACMKWDIRICKELEVDGVVFGILHRDGTIDVDRVSELVKLAYPMKVTFHRAFDMSSDPIDAFQSLCSITPPISRVLTSGHESSALEGSSEIKRLVRLSRKHQGPQVVAGGGVTERNASRIIRLTGVSALHGSLQRTRDSTMQYRKEHCHMGGALRPAEFSVTVASAERISSLMRSLHQADLVD
eukprot:CAMPEP_0174230010 /NCGR_PEP_ID=MMETSP0417-20130205/853_1 /TAXON_ID=242541 /ORGANISM="Mayorella sp, Strain BSH-02190019" /LENGTH=458 /DNA_ID=CAMNT_0015307629 /DNA_START=3 /DNA_END=1379 /DNA_ORIENTATION=+